MDAVGIAARFVSGYYYLDSNVYEHDLHAWVEAYIPGAGWVGFDPSHGAMAGRWHIPICASAYYEHAMPVTGSFRGGVKQHYEYQPEYCKNGISEKP